MVRLNNQAAAPQSSAANQLCALGSANGITCAVVAQPGKHDWPFASHAFAAALPWLAGQIRTPGVPPIPLPTPPPRSVSYVRPPRGSGYRRGMPDEPTQRAGSRRRADAHSPCLRSRVPAEPADTGYTPSGVPTFESVREKIETRYGTAIGAAELDAETPEGRTVEEQYDARQRAAAERLAQIRESMRTDEGTTQ